MDLKTKFNLGDRVWFMHNNRPVESPVYAMVINIEYKPGEWCLTDQPEWYEQIQVTDSYPDDRNKRWIKHYQAFSSKEDLLKTL